MEKKLKLIGYIAITLGSLAALLCVVPILYGVFYAMLLGFLGLITSSIYIFIDTKNEINQKKITAGVIAMILSSIPVLLMLSVIIMSKFKH